MAIAHILAPTSITVVANFQPHVIASSHVNFERIKALVADPDATEADVIPLLNVPKTINTYTAGKVTVKNGKLYLDHGDGRGGWEVRTSLAAKILEFVRTGDDKLATSLKAFLEKVSENPDPRAQTDLFDWLQASKLPITGDGYILAWKAVTKDYRSIYAPSDVRFDHCIGKRVEQPRAECDANPDRTCSQGLHFCAASYLSSYAGGGNRIVVVKIHPRDVVAFPRDYNLAKGRACGYDVVGEVPYDKVPDYYPQGRPVYTGFDKPAPATPRFFGANLEVGGVYRLRNGSNAVCTSVDNRFADLRPTKGLRIVAYRDGRQYGSGGLTNDKDVVKQIEFPLTADDFAVGQKWVNRSGKTVEIIEIRGSIMGLSNGDCVYRENGRVYQTTTDTKSPPDLVFRLGWEPASVTEPFKLEVGKRYLDRVGNVVTMGSRRDGQLDVFYAGVKNIGYTGNNWRELPAGRVNTVREDQRDLVELANPAAGERWETRNGTVVTIGAYGREIMWRNDGAESPHDLVRRISK